MVRLDLGDPGDEPDHEQASVPSHAPADLVERVAADRVVGDVDATSTRFSDRIDPIGGLLVVDHDVGAEVASQLDLGRTAGDGDRFATHRLRQLDRCRAGSARSTGDQHPLVGLEMGPLLEGVDRREDVSALVGLLVMASADVLAPLPEGEFYWFELVGCRVESAGGEVIGEVREIWETGAHDVLLVEDEDGVRRLVPTAEALLEAIDLEARLIVVADLPGLLEPV